MPSKTEEQRERAEAKFERLQKVAEEGRIAMAEYKAAALFFAVVPSVAGPWIHEHLAAGELCPSPLPLDHGKPELRRGPAS